MIKSNVAMIILLCRGNMYSTCFGKAFRFRSVIRNNKTSFFVIRLAIEISVLKYVPKYAGKLRKNTGPGQMTILLDIYPATIYLFKVKNKNTRRRCETCSNLTIKTPEQCQWRCPDVFYC